ncbi:MAG TPA: response regulator [Blastocatellia bacterium]|nr:response regulator [Blastocatellia bacterium]
MSKKILVVEDNLDMRELLHLYLKREGFTVLTAADGREGLYLTTSERPDLIITDINMPNLDGIEMMKQIRSHPELADISIIVLTAFGFVERNNAIRAGANRAVDKPADFDFLIANVKELLDQQKGS